jgi:Zn-dependent peptidase ImmA (M78 family)
MPEQFLKKDWLRLRLENLAAPAAIQSLAMRYKVSPKAMEFRLVNLGFVSAGE